MVCLAVNLLIRLSNAPFSNISLCPRGVRASIPQKKVRKADEKVITTVFIKARHISFKACTRTTSLALYI